MFDFGGIVIVVVVFVVLGRLATLLQFGLGRLLIGLVLLGGITVLPRASATAFASLLAAVALLGVVPHIIGRFFGGFVFYRAFL